MAARRRVVLRPQSNRENPSLRRFNYRELRMKWETSGCEIRVSIFSTVFYLLHQIGEVVFIVVLIGKNAHQTRLFSGRIKLHYMQGHAGWLTEVTAKNEYVRYTDKDRRYWLLRYTHIIGQRQKTSEFVMSIYTDAYGPRTNTHSYWLVSNTLEMPTASMWMCT